MPGPRPRSPSSLLLALAVVLLASCGRDGGGVPRAPADGHPLLGSRSEAARDEAGDLPPSPLLPTLEEAALAATATAPAARITVDYPHEGSIFPPDFTAPTFLWHDDAGTDTWLLRFEFAARPEASLEVLVPRASPPVMPVDPRAIGETNELYTPTPYQASAVAWTPTPDTWDLVKRRSSEAPAIVTLTGFAANDLRTPRSRGRVTLSTSQDEVGAPIFYRDVPLMPVQGASGRIQPLGQNALPLIGWRLKDVSRDDSRLVLEGMPSCGNCHSFSRDGRVLGMDIDGPTGDKGTYALAPIRRRMSIGFEDIITWNDFPKKPEGHKTIGFLSRVSPDGRYAVTTINEELYVSNFLDYRYLQVFFPTRGILAYYDRDTGRMEALPGADDPAYVHTNAVWSPDGEWLVFSRAPASEPYAEGRPPARYPNDPNEPQIRYDLYRIPFHGGKGGAPEPVAGASANGMSNTFPKISPDGKWIVWTKCRNGLLMRPDGRLWIVPSTGGEAREMSCNTDSMNSWHSFSPNGRWLVFSSKVNTPYTQMFLTHLDEEGNDSPPILIPGTTASNRAVNLPEFLNAPYDALEKIEVPAAEHHTYFKQAIVLLDQGRTDEAIPFLEKAIALNPGFGPAHANLGLVLAARNEHEAAIAQYRAALDANPAEHFARNNLGRSLEALGRTAEAVAEYRKVLAEEPGMLLARRNLAHLLLAGPDPRQAVPHLRKVLEQDPGDLESRRLLAQVLLATGHASDGVRELEAILDRDPEDLRALSTLAWVLATSQDAHVRDGRRAVELAMRAVAASGRKRPEPLDALAAALAESGRYEEAAAVAGEALALLASRPGRLAEGLAARRDLYRRGKPYRQ